MKHVPSAAKPQAADQTRLHCILVLFAGAVLGCHPLPPGSLASIAVNSSAPRQGSVYLIRGWQDLWSEGLDQLSREIHETGRDAHVYRESQWRDLADAIARRYQSGAGQRPLVLIGFSYGADDALRIARKLDGDSIPVDLLIAIDPVTPPRVPGNVRACYNYFQTNGIWDVFPWLRGIPLTASRPGQLTNVDLRRDRPDLLEPDTSHATIAANPKLHREILRHL
jgi:pimeloyl-ACP methyl ester carboxylesterase